MDTYDKVLERFKGRVTVKNCKIMTSMSEETLCFTASVYFDGKKIGTADNRGHGGPGNFDPKDASVSETLLALEHFAVGLDCTYFTSRWVILEVLIDDAVQKFSETKQVKRDIKNGNIVFTQPDGRTYLVKWPELANSWHLNPKSREIFMMAAANNKWAIVEILNDRFPSGTKLSLIHI